MTSSRKRSLYIVVVLTVFITCLSWARDKTDVSVTTETSFKSLKQLPKKTHTPDQLLEWMRKNFSYLRPKDGKMITWLNLSPRAVFDMRKGVQYLKARGSDFG